MSMTTLNLDFPAWPQYGEQERTRLIRALDQGQWWRIGGTEVDTFEHEFAGLPRCPARARRSPTGPTRWN